MMEPKDTYDYKLILIAILAGIGTLGAIIYLAIKLTATTGTMGMAEPITGWGLITAVILLAIVIWGVTKEKEEAKRG